MKPSQKCFEDIVRNIVVLKEPCTVITRLALPRIQLLPMHQFLLSKIATTCLKLETATRTYMQNNSTNSKHKKCHINYKDGMHLQRPFYIALIITPTPEIYSCCSKCKQSALIFQSATLTNKQGRDTNQAYCVYSPIPVDEFNLIK
jgi:hypothetical protein